MHINHIFQEFRKYDAACITQYPIDAHIELEAAQSRWEHRIFPQGQTETPMRFFIGMEYSVWMRFRSSMFS